MSNGANVQSRHEIEAFRSALIIFAEQCQGAIEELEVKTRRAADWIEHDRPAFWKKKVRQTEDEVQQAKLSLEHCLMFPVADERPSCHEERTELRKMKAKLDHVRTRVERVRHWRQQLQHEQRELSGRVGILKQILEQKIPRAISTLDQILDRLEAYTLSQTMTTGPVTPPVAVGNKETSDKTKESTLQSAARNKSSEMPEQTERTESKRAKKTTKPTDATNVSKRDDR